MKRVLIIILTFILCFSFPISVFATGYDDNPSDVLMEDTNGDGVINYNDWSSSDKACYWGYNAVFLVSGVLGVNPSLIASSLNNSFASKAATRGYNNIADFMVRNSNYVGANEDPEQPEAHFEFTPTALEVFNEIKVELEEDAKYINFYPTDSSYLFQENVTSFPNSYFMNALNNVIHNNPDKYFYIVNNRTVQTAGEGCYILYWFDNDIAGVTNYKKSIEN